MEMGRWWRLGGIQGRRSRIDQGVVWRCMAKEVEGQGGAETEGVREELMWEVVEKLWRSWLKRMTRRAPLGAPLIVHGRDEITEALRAVGRLPYRRSSSIRTVGDRMQMGLMLKPTSQVHRYNQERK